MIALSIRQPWAWLILHAGKDIENRNWPTRRRQRVLIHASKGMSHNEWLSAIQYAHLRCGVPRETLQQGCEFEQLERGGIVGSVEITDCVQSSDSPWFAGPHGWVLRDPRPQPFLPWIGRLGFFEVPEAPW